MSHNKPEKNVCVTCSRIIGREWHDWEDNFKYWLCEDCWEKKMLKKYYPQGWFCAETHRLIKNYLPVIGAKGGTYCVESRPLDDKARRVNWRIVVLYRDYARKKESE